MKITLFLLTSIFVFAGQPAALAGVDRAIGMNDMATFQSLISRLKNVDLTFNSVSETPLTLAALNGRAEMVALLLKRGADVNHVTKTGYSALMFSAMVHGDPAGSIKTAQILLASGADKSLRNMDGKTAMDLALEMKNSGVAALLK